MIERLSVIKSGNTQYFEHVVSPLALARFLMNSDKQYLKYTSKSNLHSRL